MEAIIEKFGLVIFAFFFIAMAVETILESFRGLLLRFGITTLQSKGDLDNALAMASEFVPEGSKNQVKFIALAGMVKRKASLTQDTLAKVDTLLADLGNAKDVAGKESILAGGSAFLADLADPIRKEMEQSEAKRILYLRLISAVFGVTIAAIANIDLATLAGYDDKDGTWAGMVSYLAVGLAAAGGSSYWHDWLDRVRKLKDVSQALTVLKT
jgi:hypothetical protein